MEVCKGIPESLRALEVGHLKYKSKRYLKHLTGLFTFCGFKHYIKHSFGGT